MILKRLELQHFRNFDSLALSFAPRMNYIFGANGQGKTNLIESIYCLGLVKSFRAVADQELVQFGSNRFQISGELVNELAVNHKVVLVYNQKRKAVSIDGKRVARHTTLIGLLPVVLFNPEDHRITGGSPAERRRFLDILLSQSHRAYLAALQEFQKVLKQRNRLLTLIHEGRAKPAELEVWDESLARNAQQVSEFRHRFVNHIRRRAAEIYAEIAGGDSTLKIEYQPSDARALEGWEALAQALQENRAADLARQQTQIGPHRDDLRMMINGRDVRRHASRGEQKSVLLTLKLVEFEYLKEHAETTPILLLDDIHSELDDRRQQGVLKNLTARGQTFLTSIAPVGALGEDDASFEIIDGRARVL